jgi:hypothetical protein
VALDGQLEAGDMILQVNDICLENMPNDEAVKVLAEAVEKRGYERKQTKNTKQIYIHE